MKRLATFLLLALGLFFVPSAHAQFTNAYGQVLDINGSVYSSCSMSVTFVPSPTATQIPTVGGNGQTFQTSFPLATCDTQGNFALTLADNNQVVDGHTGTVISQWVFRVCTAPNAFTPQLCFSYTGIVTGVTMNMTPLFQMVAATLPVAGNVQVGTIGNLAKYGSISLLVDSGISALTVPIKPQLSDALQYVSPNGSDANDGLSMGTAKLTIQAACAALPSGNAGCSAGTGTIFLTPGYTGTIPTITAAISVIGGPSNIYQAYSSIADCAGVAGLINIQIPAGSGQPVGIPNQCVGMYSNVEADAIRTHVWGENPIALVDPGQAAGWTVWGSESDVDIAATTTGQAIGYDAVNTTGFRDSDGLITSATTRPVWAFHAFGAGNASTPWSLGFVCDNPGLSCFSFMTQDNNLHITQAVTASGSPQNVTVNARYTLNRLNVGASISMDTGSNQEDVQILSITCTLGMNTSQSCRPSNSYIINAIFTKNHANNATFFQYASDSLWDASIPGLIACRISCYREGDLRNFVNSSNPLSWSVIDTTGVERLYEAFLSNGVSGGPANRRIFRDIGGGWEFQNTAGMGLVDINSAGGIGVVTGGIQLPNDTPIAWSDVGGTGRGILSLDGSNTTVLSGQPTQKEIILRPNPGVTRLDVLDTGVIVSGVPLTSPSYLTATNCAGVGTAASPSVATCGSAAAGHFSCDVAATGATCQVNTSAVTANSEIFVFESDTTATGTALGVTCNTSTTVIPTSRILASSVAATSFTINLGTVTTNPACFSYEIIN